MRFEEWAIKHLNPADSAFEAANRAWEACEKLYRPKEAPQTAIRSFCHVRPDQPPPLAIPEDLKP
jgi:hypothetical protein